MLEVVTDALACFRLTRLVVDDQITRGFRNAVVKRYGQQGPGYLVGCPWCVSAYVGVGVAVARRVSPRGWGLVAQALAFSAVTGLIAEHS